MNHAAIKRSLAWLHTLGDDKYTSDASIAVLERLRAAGYPLTDRSKFSLPPMIGSFMAKLLDCTIACLVFARGRKSAKAIRCEQARMLIKGDLNDVCVRNPATGSTVALASLGLGPELRASFKRCRDLLWQTHELLTRDPNLPMDSMAERFKELVVELIYTTACPMFLAKTLVRGTRVP